MSFEQRWKAPNWLFYIYSDNYKMLMQLEVVKTGFSFKSDGNSPNQEEFL